MPRNGSGVYSLPNSPFVTATIIDATVMNSDLNDVASALTGSLSQDGQTTPTGNLPMGNFKHTGAGAATANGQYLVFGTSTAFGGAVTGVTDLTTTGNTILGDAAADTLNVGNGGFIKDASGNIGIGMTPVQVVDATRSVAGTAAFQMLNSNAGTTAAAGILAKNGTNVAQFLNTGTGYTALALAGAQCGLIYNDGTGGIAIAAANAAGTVRIAAGGSLTPQLTVAAAGLVSGVAGFNVGNSAQAAATTLDWYEEGTFTPALSGGGIGTPTYTTQTGEFQRIGNKVKFRITLVWTAGTNGATVGTVTGLPYASTSAIHVSSIMVNLLNASLTFTGSPVAYVNGSTTVQIGAQATAASLASILNPNAGTKDLYIAGEYLV